MKKRLRLIKILKKFIVRIHADINPDLAARLTKHPIVQWLRNRLIFKHNFSVCQNQLVHFCIFIEYKIAKNWQKSKRHLTPAGVQLNCFAAKRECGGNFEVSTFGKFKTSAPKNSKFGRIFDEKSLKSENFSITSFQKTRIEQFSNSPLSLAIRSIRNTTVNNLNIF